jgi:hypothetical protein
MFRYQSQGSRSGHYHGEWTRSGHYDRTQLLQKSPVITALAIAVKRPSLVEERADQPPTASLMTGMLREYLRHSPQPLES